MEFKKILAYVDERPESANTLLHAAALTERESAKVYVFDVLEALGEVDGWPNADDLEAMRTMLVQSRTEWLRLQAAKHKLSLSDVSVGLGKTSVEIIRQVLLNQHDLVIKTARGRTDGRRISFGTTAMHLVRKCPCPVWLVAPGAKAPPKKILAAVNPAGKDRVAMAKRILWQAKDLAQKFGAKLHVLHVWNPRVESLVQTKTDDVTVTRYIEARHEAAKQSLADLLHAVHLSLPERQVHLVLGNAADAIAAVTSDQKIDLVVLGQVGRSYREGLLIGSVTEEALSRLDCGIFCVKPDGFKSPIRLD